MKIIRSVIENWDNILVVAALIAAIITGGVRFVKRWKTMNNVERIAYVKRLLENLVPIAIKMVTLAEIDYGGGTGALKRAEVIDALYVRIPDEFKPYVTEANLDIIIEEALRKARILWEENYAINKIVMKKEE